MAASTKPQCTVSAAMALPLLALLVLATGCTMPGSTDPRPESAQPVHPAERLGPDQQRMVLDGLAVTLTVTSTPSAEVRRNMEKPLGIPLKEGYRPLDLEFEVLNTTDSTVTIGDQSWPVVRDGSGRVIIEPLGFSAAVSSRRGPYWGHGGPPPGRPRHSKFAPGGSLTVRIPQQVPTTISRLNVTWKLDDSREATFVLTDW